MQARQIKWLPVLMAVTITGIAAFQVYWLSKTYEREQHTLERSSNITFRETVHRLQAIKLKLEGIGAGSAVGGSSKRLFPAPEQDKVPPFTRTHAKGRGRLHPERADGEMASLVNVLREKATNDSTPRSNAVKGRSPASDSGYAHRLPLGRRARLLQFLYDVDSLQDTLKVSEIESALAQRLQQQNINVPFTVSRLQQGWDSEPAYNEVTLGFTHPLTYRLDLGNTTPYVLKRVLAPILLSIFIVGLTTLSFALLYRNLLRQRRLADIKNEFISNITHELKTPIATVSVAIEALRSFNDSMDVEKSKEYLDISANELQRLSLLVDKVLKLSMFEKQGLELRYEPLDLKLLVNEVTASMRLQSEKFGATIKTTTDGDTTLEGDRLHLVSVIFNLLDNALKYSNGTPDIRLHLSGSDTGVKLSITDNGIGIPAEYRDRVFDKFFRVPTGNVHNAKGYGLGLSYVAHVVRRHQGTITVTGAEGGGTCFVITLPKQPA